MSSPPSLPVTVVSPPWGENDLPFLEKKHVVWTYVLISYILLNSASHPEKLAVSLPGLASHQ